MAAPMIRRRDAAQATLEAYAGKPLEWGRRDCARMAAMTLRGLGYKPGLIRGGSYSNAKGALRALKRAGFDSLEAALDGLGLPRIAPAFMLVGDIVGLRSPEAGWLALGVALGNGRVLAFNPHTDCAGVAAVTPADIITVWKADPCPKR